LAQLQIAEQGCDPGWVGVAQRGLTGLLTTRTPW
jgi:hypothetical protein